MKLTLPFLVLLLVSTVVGQETKCPSIEFKGPPAVVGPGEPMTFTLLITPDSSEYKTIWTVTNGKIVSNKDHRVIEVTGPPNGTTKLEVVIEGLPNECKDTFSDTGVVGAYIPICSIEQFGKLPDNDVRNRLDLIFAHLLNAPRSYASIETRGDPADAKHFIELLFSHSRFRKFSFERLRYFYGGNSSELVTTVYWMPIGSKHNMRTHPERNRVPELRDVVPPRLLNIIESTNPNPMISTLADALEELNENPKKQLIIVSSGPDGIVGERIELIRELTKGEDKVTVVRIGKATKLATRIWLVDKSATTEDVF